MTVKKAIITAAGRGTRFLPQTKSMPKEMLPIVDKPTIQLVVEDLVVAGVDDITVVTDWRKRAIEDHFDRDTDLEDWLKATGKPALAHQLQYISRLANFSYVRQHGQPIDSARPIIDAAHLIGDQPFFSFFADEEIIGKMSVAQQMLKVFKERAQPIVALHRVSPAAVERYGIAEIARDLGGGLFPTEACCRWSYRPASSV